MSRKSVYQDEIEFKTGQVLFKFEDGYSAESEQFVLEWIQNAKSDLERYVPYLHYSEMLMKTGRWEEARDVLLQSAQVALHHKVNRWLVFSHEKLGDLSAAEGDWFGALHHYRYAMRNTVSFPDPSAWEKLDAKARAVRQELNVTLRSPDSEILALSREYMSGNMAISFVHRDIFLKKYFARCFECSFCHDACCSYGADINIQNVETILQRKDEIQPFIRPSSVEWFDKEYVYEAEYDGNLYTRINPQGPRCVFINKDGRGCGLHRYAISKQMDYHEIKPLICILFPLSFGEGILGLAPELDDDSLICAGAGDSAYRSLRQELEFYFGQEAVEELDRLEKNVVSAS